MRIVLGIFSLAHAGGTESYSVTVGDHLQRTGHDVYIYSAKDGLTGDKARALGLRVITDVRKLPPDIDAFLVQDNVSALELLEERPGTPQIYNWHSELFDLQLPPQIAGVTKLIVTLHDNANRRVRSLAVKPPVLRLTHPVDIVRFTPLNPLSPRPRKLVALGNYLSGERKDVLQAACGRAGIEFRQVGVFGEGVTSEPELAMNDADIVVGKARVVLEGMACGRAVYVYDAFGDDGWVTPDNYADLESTCFAGVVNRRTLDVEALAEELLRYDPDMGLANRELAKAHHNAMRHTGELVAAIESVIELPGPAPLNDNAFELARLARVNWRHEGSAYQLGNRLQNLERENERLRDNLVDADARMRSVVESKRWRVLSRLLRPFDRMRGRADD